MLARDAQRTAPARRGAAFLAAPALIVARGGDDVVRALGGNDKVCDGRGDDRVVLGGGKDRAIGGAGNDRNGRLAARAAGDVEDRRALVRLEAAQRLRAGSYTLVVIAIHADGSATSERRRVTVR